MTQLGAFLFEPSSLIVDVAARRRARLLAMLQLAHALQLTLSTVIVSFAEQGLTRDTIAPVLGTAAPCVLFAYALSRTRYAQLSGWLYVLISLAIPLSIIALQGPSSGKSPLLPIVYLTGSILLASALGTVRAPLIAGLTGLAAVALLAFLVASPAWVADMRRAGLFLTLQMLLIIIIGIHRDRIETDRAAELRARNEELDGLRLSLEERIRERTTELRLRNGEMRLVFDNVAEGLFTVDCSGRMSSEHSATLARWFGPLQDGEPFFQYFGRHSARFAEAAELGWQQLADGILEAAVALEQMPRSLVANGRHYRFSYQPIGSGQDGRFLALVADATSEIEHDEMQRERRETFALFERMLADRSGFLGFMEEATQIVARVLAPAERGELKRAVHTLKGNSIGNRATSSRQLTPSGIGSRVHPYAGGEPNALTEPPLSNDSRQPVQKLVQRDRVVVRSTPSN